MFEMHRADPPSFDEVQYYTLVLPKPKLQRCFRIRQPRAETLTPANILERR